VTGESPIPVPDSATTTTITYDESYELMPVLKSGYVIMGFTMIGLSFGALYGAAWAFTIMGLGYLFLFAVSNQTNITRGNNP